MKRTIAVLMCLLSLTGCSLFKGEVDCNEQACIDAKLTAEDKCTDGRRQVPLVLNNEGKNVARYKLNYYGPDIALVPGGGLGVGVLDGGKSQQHNFLSTTFDRELTITIVQQSTDGERVIHTENKKITLPSC